MLQIYQIPKLQRKWIINLYIQICICLLIVYTSCTTTMRSSYQPPRFKTRKQSQLWDHAQTFIGIPYRYGGSTRSGMDCSGVVVRLFLDVYGLRLPHKTSVLHTKGITVSKRSLQVGDLVFFRYDAPSTPSHVGVFLGNGVFIHASSSKGVILSGLDDEYYKKRYAGARRIL